jgi:hypothetical protein
MDRVPSWAVFRQTRRPSTAPMLSCERPVREPTCDVHVVRQVALLWRSGRRLFAGNIYEHHGSRRSHRLRKFRGQLRKPTQTCWSFIRCCRGWPRRANRQRCLDVFQEQVGRGVVRLTGRQFAPDGRPACTLVPATTLIEQHGSVGTGVEIATRLTRAAGPRAPEASLRLRNLTRNLFGGHGKTHLPITMQITARLEFLSRTSVTPGGGGGRSVPRYAFNYSVTTCRADVVGNAQPCRLRGR